MTLNIDRKETLLGRTPALLKRNFWYVFGLYMDLFLRGLVMYLVSCLCAQMNDLNHRQMNDLKDGYEEVAVSYDF